MSAPRIDRTVSRRLLLRSTAAGALLLLLPACGGKAAPAAAPAKGTAAGASRLPARLTPAIRARYEYVAANQALVDRVPCYCSCGQSIGHESLRDCYFDDSGKFDGHAEGCEICLDIADDIKRLSSGGFGVDAIRAQVDRDYNKFGAPTHTN